MTSQLAYTGILCWVFSVLLGVLQHSIGTDTKTDIGIDASLCIIKYNIGLDKLPYLYQKGYVSSFRAYEKTPTSRAL